MDKKTIYGTTIEEELNAFDEEMNSIDDILKAYERCD